MIGSDEELKKKEEEEPQIPLLLTPPQFVGDLSQTRTEEESTNIDAQLEDNEMANINKRLI